MLGPPQLMALLLTLLRVAELMLSSRNAVRLKAAGGIEKGARHYPLMVGLHVLWLISIFLLPQERQPNGWILGVFALLLLARLWVIASLGPFWTTRIVVMPRHRIVRRGPYRWLRHPNYLVVQAEIMVLPAVFGAWELAVGFGLANALLLVWRISVEDKALASHRCGPTSERARKNEEN